MDTNNTLTQALREAADLIAAHPDLPHDPLVTSSVTGTVHLAWYLALEFLSGEHAQQKTDAAAIVTGIGGHWDKREFGDEFRFTQTRGLLRLTVQVDRPAVCERVIIGTKTITETIVDPSYDGPTIPTVEVTREVEEVRWECSPLLADATASAVVS